MASKICAICEKGSVMGGGYSNRTRATQYNPVGKRRRHPNLQWARLTTGGRIKICTRCMKAGLHLKMGGKTSKKTILAAAATPVAA